MCIISCLAVFPFELSMFFYCCLGRIAALNMLNKPTELSTVPFYWTVLLGKTIRYAGGHLPLHTHTHKYLFVCIWVHHSLIALRSHMTEFVTALLDTNFPTCETGKKIFFDHLKLLYIIFYYIWYACFYIQVNNYNNSVIGRCRLQIYRE